MSKNLGNFGSILVNFFVKTPTQSPTPRNGSKNFSDIHTLANGICFRFYAPKVALLHTCRALAIMQYCLESKISITIFNLQFDIYSRFRGFAF